MKNLFSKLAVAMTALTMLASGNTFAAEPSICYIRGELNLRKATSFAKFVRAKRCLSINIASPGGDVDAAMLMGRAIRDAQLPVVTVEPGCKSACVLIFAAGVQRAPYGVISIHRPYSLVTGATLEQTSERYRQLEVRVKDYLRLMNVNPSLYDHMMRIPPENMQDLTRSELDAYGMGLIDPIFSEYAAGARAREFGMTRAEYMDKLSDTRRHCGDIFNPMGEPEFTESTKCWKREWPGMVKD